MCRNRNRMSSDACLVFFLAMLIGFCVEKVCMETDNGTATSVQSDEFSVFNTPTMAESSDYPLAPSSTIAKPPNAQVPTADFPPSSTTADLSNTQVPAGSTIPGLLYTTVAAIETKSEFLNTQVTPSQTSSAMFSNGSSEIELEHTRASSLDTEDGSTTGRASGTPWENNNVTDDNMTTNTTVSATALSPTTTLSNESYEGSVDNETTVFPFMDNATDYKNDTNMTSIDDSDQLGSAMTSVMTQPSDAITTTKPAANMDTSKVPEPSSSSMSYLLPSQSSLSFSEDNPPPPLPQSQEMTVTAKVALGFGFLVGISCVIVVATVSVRQCLGYWARRDYSNLDQDNIYFS